MFKTCFIKMHQKAKSNFLRHQDPITINRVGKNKSLGAKHGKKYYKKEKNLFFLLQHFPPCLAPTLLVLQTCLTKKIPVSQKTTLYFLVHFNERMFKNFIFFHIIYPTFHAFFILKNQNTLFSFLLVHFSHMTNLC